MSVLKANCPSCAAPIEFQKGSTIVLICPFCRSAVSRTDRVLEDLGKVAEIVDSESPLKIGLKGMFKDQRFELTGRAQNRHEAGGVWDEWYATFSNGWVGWLAEAQGKFYLTFYQPMPVGAAVPSFEALQVGESIAGISQNAPFIVAEKGTATAVAADGEIPYKLIPNEQSDYADLSGKGGAFGTIDYSMSPPWVFVGQEVSLADIGLADAKSVKREAKNVAVGKMGCPNCGGPLELNAPDKTERVTCPFCNSFLDVNQGNLKFLKSLGKVENPFVLKIGAEGTFKDDVKFKVIGAMVRSVTIDQKYYWHEYLLYNPVIGFRWLTHSDNHWNFVEPVNPGDVEKIGVFGAGTTARYNGKVFKIFQETHATVEYVQGEFYWRVHQGDRVWTADFIAPPLMLSSEGTKNEITWSIGTYLTNAEIEKAFNVSDLPKPWSVAPNQPSPGGFYVKWGLAMLGILLVIGVLMIPLSGFGSTPLSQQIVLPPMTNPSTPQTIFSQPFELKGSRNVRITAYAPVSNAFADLDIDLVNEQNSEIESVNIPIEYYSGSDSDGAWTEGAQTQDATLSSLPAGKYTLRVEGTWQNFQQQLPVTVKVEQNVNRGVNFCLAFCVIGFLPFVGLIRKWVFESKRWSESMFSTSNSDE